MAWQDMVKKNTGRRRERWELDKISRALSRLTDEQVEWAASELTRPGGQRIMALARLLGYKSSTQLRKRLVEVLGGDVVRHAVLARLSEGMRGNRHGVGKKFPERVKERWRDERRGTGNPNWKGGPKARHRLSYKDVVAMVLERDGHRCVKCKSQEQLVVHHIIPETARPDLLKDPNNMQTLCRACHMRTHLYSEEVG